MPATVRCALHIGAGALSFGARRVRGAMQAKAAGVGPELGVQKQLPGSTV